MRSIPCVWGKPAGYSSMKRAFIYSTLKVVLAWRNRINPVVDTGLSGKTALITGGSSGIGRAIALALAAEGVDIAIADIKKDDETLREIEAHGVLAQYIPTDVSDEAQIVQMVSSALATFEHLDLFINNAAVAYHQPITRITSDMWLKTIHTNLSACVW